MDGRRACAALVAAALLAGCGGGGRKPGGCLDRLGKVTHAFGQTTIRFTDGAVIHVVLTPTPADAQQLAPLAGGPQDPFGYKAVGRAVVAWKGGARNPHLLAVERCLRQP